jgi:hypothetical protein
MKESPSVFALGPFPIEGAPPMDDLVLLLFCPEQGGWHTGVRFEGRWLAQSRRTSCSDRRTGSPPLPIRRASISDPLPGALNAQQSALTSQ